MNVHEIRFYRSSERPFGAFSNLSRHPVIFEGRAFATAEHAYQYGKPRKSRVRDWLMDAPTPGLLAQAAHLLEADQIDPDWQKQKVDRMVRVIRAKVSQHPDIAMLLTGTGDSHIVEAGEIDDEAGRFWGRVNGQGQNTLGSILMMVRSELRGEPSRLVEPQRSPFQGHRTVQKYLGHAPECRAKNQDGRPAPSLESVLGRYPPDLRGMVAADLMEHCIRMFQAGIADGGPVVGLPTGGPKGDQTNEPLGGDRHG